MRWFGILIAVLLIACETHPSATTPEDSAAGVLSAQAVEGFPLPVPAGTLVRAVKSATTEEKPIAGADVELAGETTSEVEAVVGFYTRLLTAKGLKVERHDHERPSGREPDAPLVRIVRVVGQKQGTRVFIVLTRGAKSRKLQIAVAGKL